MLRYALTDASSSLSAARFAELASEKRAKRLQPFSYPKIEMIPNITFYKKHTPRNHVSTTDLFAYLRVGRSTGSLRFWSAKSHLPTIVSSFACAEEAMSLG